MLVSDKARHLYTKMRSIQLPNFLIKMNYKHYLILKGSELMEYLQELVNGKYVKISKMGDQLKFQTVAEEEAKKYRQCLMMKQ